MSPYVIRSRHGTIERATPLRAADMSIVCCDIFLVGGLSVTHGPRHVRVVFKCFGAPYGLITNVRSAMMPQRSACLRTWQLLPCNLSMRC